MSKQAPSLSSPKTFNRLPGEIFWAVSDLFYGGLVAVLVAWFIPIETAKYPALPLSLVAWGLTHFILGLGSLFICKPSRPHLRRRCWQMNVALTVFSVVLGVTLAALILMSGLYWLGVFGVLGWGVFISSTLLLSGVLQILFLYPVLKLRRLLSHPFRALFKGGGVPLLALKASFLLLAVTCLVGAYAGSLSEVDPLTQDQRDLVTSYLRSTLEGSPATPSHSALSYQGVIQGPIATSPSTSIDHDGLASLRDTAVPDVLYISFYAGGQRIVRVSGRGYDLASATKNAAHALATHPKLRGKRLRGGRIIVDRVIGTATIPLSRLPLIGPIILSLSVDPGRDGLRSHQGGAHKTVLPSDLVEGGHFAVTPIVPGIPELRFGLNSQFVDQRLGPLHQVTLERIRTEQWIERVELTSPEQTPPQEEHLTATTLRGHWGDRQLRSDLGSSRAQLLDRREVYQAAAHRSGHYLVTHQGPDGRFNYQYFPYLDEIKQPPDNRYSIPRHAGAIYGLSMLYKDRADPSYRNAAEQAIKWLIRYSLPECGGWSPARTCIPKISKIDQIAKLGDSALSALAVLSYLESLEQHGESPPRYAERLAEGLVEFLLSMQRADGDFYHKKLLYDDSVVPHQRSMFASEQAAFALVLAAKRWPEGPWRLAAERALDALTIAKYEGDFLSGFFYGADHWTCLAAYAAAPLIQKDAYQSFCLNYARFLQRLQYRQEDQEGDLSYHGHYGFGFLSPPQAPATGGFSEGVMGALLLAEAYGTHPSELQDLYDQVFASTEALVHDQITERSRWRMKNFSRAKGAFRRSLVESEVRVDFVQHCLSALLMTTQLSPL